jgi:hypothetical protein
MRLVLYNDTDNNSLIPGNVPAATAIVPWSDAHIPSTDTAGSLNDEGSSTYILMRARQNPDNVRKEILPDLDFDGVVDFGTEAGPFYGGSSPEAVQPFQRVDELAWSNAGGKEYVSDSDRELSETPGFNPDFIARIEYYFDNPMLGHRTRPDGSGGFEILPTRTADESFVYGEVSMGVTADTSADFLGLAQTKGPTDQSATPYDGSCDPEPYDPGPNPACVPSAGGSFLFTDVDLTGWEVTPGDYNDGAGLFQIRLGVAQSGDDLPAGFSGRVWADGDLDFDGVVDGDDLSLAQQFLGATPGDTEPASDPQGEDTVRWVYQLSEFQALEMARHLDSADGPMGGNANAVTEADLDALTAMIALPGDTNGDGAVDLNDLLTVLSNFGDATAGGAADGDIDGNGEVDLNDLLTVLSNFGATTF